MRDHIQIPLVLAAGVAASLAAEPAPSTFCNPLPLPNYPIGRMARDISNGDPLDAFPFWLLDRKEVFRELADPSALWLDGKWYLYPSVDMAWVSEDLGATRQHHPLDIRDVGLDPKKGINPGPFHYRVEIEIAQDQWTTLLDRSNNTVDLLIDYHETTPHSGSRARFIILG